MGRPLNKKYFGYENTGDSGENQSTYTRGSGIGLAGEGIANITITAGGTYTAPPSITIAAPAEPGGSTATATPIMSANTVSSLSGTQTMAYNANDLLEYTGQGSTILVNPVLNSSINVTITATTQNSSLSYINLSGSVSLVKGTSITTPAGISTTTGLAASTTYYVASTVSAATQIPISATYGGAQLTTQLTTGSVTGGSSTVVGATYNTVSSFQGANGGWGGRFSGTLPSNPVTVTQIANPANSNIVGQGAGATINFTYHVVGVNITDQGSGYLTVPTVTFGGAATGTAVLTTDSGTPYSAEAFPGIIAYAQTTSGGSSKVAQINRQKGSHRYYVTTSDGSTVCALQSSAANAIGQMTITATDSSSGTYWVTKLTGHKATLVQHTGTAFANNTSVHWTFSSSDPSYVSGTTVIIANA